jgi:hypothetical protein
MKSATLLKAVYKDCLERGYVADGNDLYPPGHSKGNRNNGGQVQAEAANYPHQNRLDR